MNIRLDIDQGQLDGALSGLAARLEALRQPVQAAMADAMEGIVLANFGSQGFMRPWDWQPLSAKYAKKVGRTYATLFVTGALKSTLRKDTSDPDGASVTMGNNGLVNYALAHHHGNPGNFGTTVEGSGELPARRVFPLDEADHPTPESVELVRQAALSKLKEVF
jgi:hypothetical protein